MRDPLGHLSIRWKLLGTLALTGGLAALIGGYSYGAARRAVREATGGMLTQSARQGAESVRAFLAHTVARTCDFASDGLIRAAVLANDTPRTVLDAHLAQHKRPIIAGLSEVAVVDLAGPVRGRASAPDLRVFEPPAPAGLAAVRAGRSWVGVRRLGSRTVVEGVAPLLDAAGLPRGLVLNRLDPVALGRAVLATLPASGDVPLDAFIVRGGTIIAGGRHGGAAGRPQPAVGPAPYRSYHGRTTMGQSAPIAGTELRVIVEAPLDRIEAPIRALGWRFAAAGVGLAVVLLGALLFPLRFVVVPLVRMRRAARAIEHGHLDVRVAVESADEIGALAAAINRLAIRTGEQRELAERAALVEKLGAVGRVAAGVAHELSTPLGSVVLYADELRALLGPEGVAPDDRTTLLEYAAAIQSETYRCRDIVRSLLDFSRRPTHRLEAVDATALVNEAVALISAGGTRAAVTIAPIPPHLAAVQADPTLLRGALLNVLANACDAAGPHGAVSVTVNSETARVAIVVTDDGPGIPAALLPRVLEPFFTTKPPGEGTGLGLAVAHRDLRWMGGDLVIHSDTGRGTSVRLELRPAPTGAGRPAIAATETGA